ncbi:MAG: hypothetical protein ACOYB3_06685 [Azonexus sp.]
MKKWRVWFSVVALLWVAWFLLRAFSAVWNCETADVGYSRGFLPPDCSIWWGRLGWPAFLPFALLGLAVWLVRSADAIKKWRVWFSVFALLWWLLAAFAAHSLIWDCENRQGPFGGDCSYLWWRYGWLFLVPVAPLGLAVWLAPLGRWLVSAAKGKS